MNYENYLLSEHWSDTKRRYYEVHSKVCSVCQSGKNVHLHHMTYKRLGEELLSDLIPLCGRHHAEFHTFFTPKGRKMRRNTSRYVKMKRANSAPLSKNRMRKAKREWRRLARGKSNESKQ